ncbi:hypothetical protein [Pseudogemmobacter sp. W21_MBD1_M6]|uniref:hypothetical protein n=1 Tax=Pseudogemmobacter sp. W21_MBD1_M6 TaxID=3240271 RepID=UPI003F94D1F0
MRKKIPTVTRPDPTYSAALLQADRDIPERREKGPAPVIAKPASVADPVMHPLGTETERTEAPHTVHVESTGQDADPKPSVPTRTKTPTRKIDIRVNALERQEAALQACGVEPAHVVRAALRRAVKGWHLSPIFAPASDKQRTRNTQWQARTSLAVDTTSLAVLLRDHDPLDVLSKWALIRGQVEPRIWAEIDILLDELMPNAEPSRYGNRWLEDGAVEREKDAPETSKRPNDA